MDDAEVDRHLARERCDPGSRTTRAVLVEQRREVET
jgi:hypothetical protein